MDVPSVGPFFVFYVAFSETFVPSGLGQVDTERADDGHVMSYGIMGFNMFQQNHGQVTKAFRSQPPHNPFKPFLGSRSFARRHAPRVAQRIPPEPSIRPPRVAQSTGLLRQLRGQLRNETAEAWRVGVCLGERNADPKPQVQLQSHTREDREIPQSHPIPKTSRQFPRCRSLGIPVLPGNDQTSSTGSEGPWFLTTRGNCIGCTGYGSTGAGYGDWRVPYRS